MESAAGWTRTIYVLLLFFIFGESLLGNKLEKNMNGREI